MFASGSDKDLWPRSFYYAAAVLLLFVTVISSWLVHRDAESAASEARRQADIAAAVARPGLVLESVDVERVGYDGRQVRLQVRNYGGGPAWSVKPVRLAVTSSGARSALCRASYFSPEGPRYGGAVWPSQTVEFVLPMPTRAASLSEAAFLSGEIVYGSAAQRTWRCGTFVVRLGPTVASGTALGSFKPDVGRGVSQ